MSARLAVTRAQARAIAAVAKEHGCIIEVEHDGVVYRVIPEALAERNGKSPSIDRPGEINL